MPKFWKILCFCQKGNQEIASTNKTKKLVHSYKVIATEKVLKSFSDKKYYCKTQQLKISSKGLSKYNRVVW